MNKQGEENKQGGYVITLSELVARLQDSANKMSKHNPNRLLLFNSASALTALGQELEKTQAALKQATAAPKVVTPGGWLHSVN